MHITQLWPQVAAHIPNQDAVTEELEDVNYYDAEDLTLFMIHAGTIDVAIDDESANSDTLAGYNVTKSDQEGSFVHTASCYRDGTVSSIAIEGIEVMIDDYLEMYA